MAFRKTRLYFRLLEALATEGCPVCSLLLEDGLRYLDAVMYERITDVPTREQWRESFGLCNLHTWQLTKVPESSAPDLGFAIIAADLLRRFDRSQSDRQSRSAGRLGALREVLARIRTQWSNRSGRATCPACDETGAAESYQVHHLLECLQEDEFRRRYEGSSGVCLPHFFLVAKQWPRHPTFPVFRAMQLAKARSLRRKLEEFTEAQDHRSRARLTAEHASAWRRALEFLAGKPGTFNNELDSSRSRRFR